MSFKKPIHIFDLNGTLIKKDLGMFFEHYFREKIIEPLFEPLLSITNDKWRENFPEAVNQSISQKVVHDRVLEIVVNPPKHTPAREAYYSIVEGELRGKKIDVGVAPDVLNEQSALMQLHKNKVDIMLLSKGTASLLEALLEASSLKQYFSFFDSTIPYGNVKNKDTFLNLIKNLSDKGYEVRAFYEDEVEAVKELDKARKELQGKSGQFPFKIYWINRDNMDKSGVANLKEVEIHSNLLFDPLI